MLYPSSNINWLNTSTHEHGDSSIGEFMVKYAHLSTLKVDPKFTYFDFSNEPIHIQDSFGWSKIHAIVKAAPSDETEWYKIATTRAGTYVIVTSTQLLPVYDTSKLHVGFHGIEMYDVTPTRSDQLTQRCALRIKDLGKNEFMYPETIELYHPQYQYVPSYFIQTESRFFNVNGIQLISQDDIFPSGIAHLKP